MDTTDLCPICYDESAMAETPCCQQKVGHDCLDRVYLYHLHSPSPNCALPPCPFCRLGMSIRLSFQRSFSEELIPQTESSTFDENAFLFSSSAPEPSSSFLSASYFLGRTRPEAWEDRELAAPFFDFHSRIERKKKKRVEKLWQRYLDTERNRTLTRVRMQSHWMRQDRNGQHPVVTLARGNERS